MNNKLFIKDKYGITPNELLNNPEISLKAKGLFGYLQSKPDGWKFSVNRMANQLKEGPEAISNALHELEEFGYLTRTPVKDEKGQFQGYNYQLSVLGKSRKRKTPLTENHPTISNKESSKKDISNKEVKNTGGLKSAGSSLKEDSNNNQELATNKSINDPSLKENQEKERENSAKREKKKSEALELTKFFYATLRPNLPAEVISWDKEVRSMKLLLKKMPAHKIKAYIEAIKNCKEFHCLKCNSPTYFYSNLQSIYEELYKR